MQDPNEWRTRLAERIAAAYAVSPNAEVVMIAGSVGRGRADQFSDIEVDVYYRKAPTEAERIAAVEACGATLVELAEDEDEWEEQMRFGDSRVGDSNDGGFKAHSSTFLISTMERYLHQVALLGEVAPSAQTRLYSLQHAIPFKGEAQIELWRQQVAAYPDALAHAMLGEKLSFANFWVAAEMLAARDDRLLLYDIFIRTAQQLIGALHGLNRLYLPTPAHLKWMDEMIEAMRIKPENFGGRLKRLFCLQPVEGVDLLRQLIQETFDLVEKHEPDFDLSPYRAGVMARRRAWDGPPF